MFACSISNVKLMAEFAANARVTAKPFAVKSNGNGVKETSRGFKPLVSKT
jgi:hypothetical protein